MYVQITKCTKPYGWYRDRIGNVFEVETYPERVRNYRLKSDHQYLVNKDDCIILQEVTRAVRLGEKILVKKPWLANGEYKKGDIYEITSHPNELGVRVEGVVTYISHPEYVVLEPAGRYAYINNPDKFYTTYMDFAVKHGYPDAAVADIWSENRIRPRYGEKVKLLTSGKHERVDEGTLWIIETSKGDQFIIKEEGLNFIQDVESTPASSEECIENLTQSIAELALSTTKEIRKLTSKIDELERKLKSLEEGDGFVVETILRRK